MSGDIVTSRGHVTAGPHRRGAQLTSSASSSYTAHGCSLGVLSHVFWYLEDRSKKDMESVGIVNTGVDCIHTA